MKTTKHSNKLINETSPYLLQHAYNPVNWCPWGGEAFERAKAENKPVLLSIGYSTCHWCHVMGHESFEDDEVADFLNQNFISIKVDREERPDIDSVYMNVCQALTGSGGWPLTILMTPDQKPFFAGTYFPKKSRYGRPGLLDILRTAADRWRTAPNELTAAGGEIAAAISAAGDSAESYELDSSPVEKAAKYFDRAFDEEFGGFGYSPKFPTPHNLMFLVRCHLLKIHPNALFMVEKTLQQMYRGGIFDHIGYGFSRYSTDERWLVPHFEKMLYDNALLTISLLETAQVTGNPFYKEVAEKNLSYIQREMTSPEGGFYSAQDADSEGEEGRYYTFTLSEIAGVLGSADGERFCRYFDITDRGNFEGRNIPNLIDNPDFEKPDPEIENMLPRLREYRLNRTALHKDDKILTSWNALTVVAYIRAYRALGEARYLVAARRALAFIKEHLTDSNGNLLISYREGRAKGSGLLDDYAFLAWAYLEMYEATCQIEYLEICHALAQTTLVRFSDSRGGFFMNPSDSEPLIYRPKEQYDGAMPSGNSVLAYCLIRLAAYTGQEAWREAADRQLKFYGRPFSDHPASFSFALMALMQAVYPTAEIVCLVKDKQQQTEVSDAFSRGFYPWISVLIKTPENAKQLEKIAPITQINSMEQTLTAIYVSSKPKLRRPVRSLDEVMEMIALKIPTKSFCEPPAFAKAFLFYPCCNSDLIC